MPRYIDADALFEKLTGIPLKKMTDEDQAEWRRCMDILGGRSAFKHDIADAPTVDVVERKAGKWVKHKDRACWYCSECKADNYYAYTWDCDTGEYEYQDRYCPSCGAMMKGEDDD